MNLLTLRNKLNDLLAAGVDSTLPVVIPSLDPADDTLSVNELTKLVMRDNENYQYDTEKCAVLHKTGSVLALGSLGNDGWQNQSEGTTHVIRTDSLVNYSEVLTDVAKDNSEIFEHSVYRLDNFTGDELEKARDCGFEYVFYKTPFGDYHKLLGRDRIEAIITIDPKRIIKN